MSSSARRSAAPRCFVRADHCLNPNARSIHSETFTASRWTKGNLFFPVRIIVTPQHVSRIKSRLFGSSEESIALGKVASVQISTGVIWSNIRIDSSGGTAPITSHGHRKADALRIRELIESYQAETQVKGEDKCTNHEGHEGPRRSESKFSYVTMETYVVHDLQARHSAIDTYFASC